MNVQQTFEFAEVLGIESLSKLESLLYIGLLIHLKTAVIRPEMRAIPLSRRGFLLFIRARLELGIRSFAMASRPQGVTELLIAWNQGDQAALDQLLPVVYDELRRLARSYLR